MVLCRFLVIFLISFSALGQVVPRDVLAIWKSPDGKLDHATSLIHQKLEVIFNHYGFRLHYHDISKGLPPNDLGIYAGIVTWFNEEGMKEPAAYSRWLETQLKAKKKVLILGELGFSQNEQKQSLPLQQVNAPLQRLGFSVTESYFDNPLLISVQSSKGKDFVEFERSLENEITSFREMHVTGGLSESWLSLTSAGTKTASDVVVVGPKGGYVQNGFALFFHPQNDQTSWRVNPFRLVERIFVDPSVPVPDVTTLNGKRVFFTHIDGDGFLGNSEVFKDLKCGEIILKEIIQRYQLPTTASVITGELGQPEATDLAKKIFSDPNVEPASHTLSHPLSWARLPSAQEVKNYLGPNSSHTGPILSYPSQNPTLDYRKETSGSIATVNSLLSGKGKRASTLLWSGSCRPPVAALQELTIAGFLNMNGGDSRMDDLYNSYSHLSGLYRALGDYVQVYSANANENIYTDLWSPPYAGFREVIKTFQKTETPVRIKPVNVYYHFYSGQFHASLKSLHLIFEWVKSQDLIAIFASDYIRTVVGFQSAEISRDGAASFHIRNHPGLKTLRLANSKLFPDYAHSENIIGHQVFRGGLYVFLGSAPDSKLKLTSVPPTIPHLVSANSLVESVRREKNALVFSFTPQREVRAKFWEKGREREFILTKNFSVRLSL